MLRKLYEWMLAIAESPRAVWVMGIVSFAESSFFPIPPDVMLVPMALARPNRVWLYVLVCTVTSVIGGLLGYAIGALLYDTVGQWLFRLYGLESGAEAFRTAYAQYGAWIILLKGVTPIPYKLVTITSGFAGYDLLSFFALSVITRGVRFCVFGLLLSRFAPQIKGLLDRHLGVAVAFLLATIVGGFAAVKFLY